MTNKTTWTTDEIEYAMAHSGPAPREDAKIALVQFDSSTKTYCYWLLPGTAPAKQLVVQSPYSGPTLVTVCAIKPASELDVSYSKLKLAVSQPQFNKMTQAKRQRGASTLVVHNAPPLERKFIEVLKPNTFEYINVDSYAKFAEHFFTRTPRTTDVNRVEPTKENSTMNIEITNATFINGTNVKDYTDSQLMGMMQQLDKDIAQLKTMEPLPKRFAKRLEKLETSKQALFELLDSAE